MKKFNGKRLRNARLYRGLTLAELGDMVGVSKQSLSLYENSNEVNIDFSLINKLSEKLHFPIKYFHQKDSADIVSDATYFRSLVSTTKKSRVAQIMKVEHIGALYEALYKYIDFPKLNLPRIDFDYEARFVGNNEINDDKLSEIAGDVRNLWGLGEGPIIDLQYNLEENGIVVTNFDTKDKKIDAFSQRITIDNLISFVIVLSGSKKSMYRMNFDMAHELGHILLHPWTEDIETLSREEFREREAQANKFAGRFLLPEVSFIKDVSKHPRELEYYIHLKEKWNCSAQAMIFRANDLNVITNNQFQYLMRQVSAKGWRKQEPKDIPAKLNKNVFQGAIDLLLNNGYTKSDLMNIFYDSSIAMFNDEIEELLGLAKDTLYIEATKKPERDNIIQLKF